MTLKKTAVKFFFVKIALARFISIFLLLVLATSFLTESLELGSHLEETGVVDLQKAGYPDGDHCDGQASCQVGLCHFGFCQSHLLPNGEVILISSIASDFQLSHDSIPSGPFIEGLLRPPRI